MKLLAFALKPLPFLLAIALLLNACVAKKETSKGKNNKLASVDSSSLSFNYGILLGASLEMQGIPSDSINPEELVAGLEAALKNKMSDEQLQEAQNIFMSRMDAMKAQQAEIQRAEEKKWFDKNAKNNPKVKTLESGIQYEVLQAGEGKKPTAADEVTTHYHGTLTDGTVFDSSVERGEPATFPVMGVIKGWQEILQLMPLGSKWKVYIPSELAYGSRAVGNIPPNSILIFEIELLNIEE